MSTKEKGKNVIWFLVDQMRNDAVSINVDPNVFTPNIDLLAMQGVNFRNAVSGTPLCSPYRGSLLTNLYTHKALSQLLRMKVGIMCVLKIAKG